MGIFYNKKEEELRVGRIIIAIIIVVFSLIMLISSISRVPVGSVGVETHMAKVTGKTYSSGWYLKQPFADHIIDMSIQQQTIEYDTIQGELSGKELINMDLKMVYSLNPNMASYVYENYGTDYMDSLLPKEEVFDVVKGLVATYDIEDIRTNRAEIMSKAATELKNRFSSRGVLITSLALSNYDFGDLEASIHDEVVAKQQRKTVSEQNRLNVEKAENDKKVAEIEAQKSAAVKKTEAEAEANAVKIKAEGEAEAIKIKGAAEAEANKKLSESLTPDLVEMKRIERWNGSKATVILGEQNTPLVTVPTEETSSNENK